MLELSIAGGWGGVQLIMYFFQYLWLPDLLAAYFTVQSILQYMEIVPVLFLFIFCLMSEGLIRLLKSNV
jgi:hypothetical protein